MRLLLRLFYASMVGHHGFRSTQRVDGAKGGFPGARASPHTDAGASSTDPRTDAGSTPTFQSYQRTY
jgi:hypothetical protein